MRLALVRHPKPDVAAGICYGRLDLALHADATTGAIHAALDRFRAASIWSSPALRCRAVAEPLARRWATTPVIDPRLLELDFGEWEGVAWDDVPRESLDRWAQDPMGFAAPGGETGAALVDRVTAFHADLVAQGRDAVVISHGGPLKVLLALLRGQPIDLLAPPPGIGEVVELTA